MTKRQQIIESFADAMRTITGMSTKVFIAKDPQTLSDKDMPCIIVKDGRADTSRESLNGTIRHRLTVDASYWATGTTAWQSVQNGLQAMLAAFNADSTLGGLVTIDELTGHDVFTSQAGSIDAAGVLELALTYCTDANTL